MADAPPSPNVVSHLLSTHHALVDTLTSFLTVATHHILFLRRLYPPVSFLATRAYNYPVRQNRHPAVCAWINDAVAAVRDQLDKNTVDKVFLCIYECQRHRVVERWTLDLHSFPSVLKRDHDAPLEYTADDQQIGDAPLFRKVNLADLEANFRATLSRISTAAARLTPLPEGDGAPECSFTLAIDVRDNADRPVGRLEKEERKWIAAEPDPFASTEHDHDRDHDDKARTGAASGSQTHPVRRLEAGDLRMEIWVEEGAAKFELARSPPVSGAERRAHMSYGAGTERFDPENMYKLEPADIHRMPLGGATTDYQRG